MKPIIASLLIFGLANTTVTAQDFDMHKFGNMTLNGTSMDDLFENGDGSDWSFFKSKMGEPLKEYREFVGKENPHVESNRIYFEYDGAKFIYDDEQGEFWILLIEITSTDYVFIYDGLQIKTWNNISTLSNKFPQDYAERDDGRILIAHELGDIWMEINYNSSNVITRIELLQNLL